MVEEPAKKKGKHSDWELESSFDLATTLEDLINSPPFKEASDEKGESVTSGTRIPMWLHRRVVKLKEMAGSPYEVNSDVLRDAVYAGLQILFMRYGITQDWNVERKMAAAVDASGALKRLRDQLDMLISGIEELSEEGDMDQAAQKLADYVMAAKDLENKWHRDKVFRMLRDSKVIKEVLGSCTKEIQDLVRKEEGGGRQ